MQFPNMAEGHGLETNSTYIWIIVWKHTHMK